MAQKHKISGTNRFTARGGITGDDDANYFAGVKFWDTASDMVHAYKLTNPQDTRPEWEILDEFIVTNHITDAQGRDCLGVRRKFAVIHPGVEYIFPDGNKIAEPTLRYANCPDTQKRPPNPNKPTPPLTVIPPAPETPAAEIREPNESLRYATPASDGRYLTPESMHYALELKARVGGNPQFTRAWYALEDVAARIPVMFAKQSGQVGGRQKDGADGDFLMEGRHGIGENRESHRDDGKARKDSQNSGKQRVFIAGYNEATIIEDHGVKYVQLSGQGKPGPRMSLKEFGIADDVAASIPVGTLIRSDKPMTEWAHGGDYSVVWPLPVGIITGPADKQMPFDAEQRRWGLTQSHAVLSWEDFVGRDTIFRDTQAKTSSPMETADRIEASAWADNDRREFTNAMRAFDKETDPAKKAQYAETALTAWRDLGDNMLIQRVDAKAEQLRAGREGLENYFRSQGIDAATLSAIDGRVATAPRLPLRFMDEKTLHSLQDWSPTNPQYQGIVPGGIIPGYEATEARVFRVRNYSEERIAKGYGRERSEADMVAASYNAWKAIDAKPDAIKAIGRGMTTNYELATEFGEGLCDMPRNYKAYGFTSKEQAQEFILRFAGNDPKVRDQLLNNGATMPNTIVPLPGRDSPHNMQLPREFGAVAGKYIQEHPEAFAEAMERFTNPSYMGAKSDGRRTGIAMLRALGSERGAKRDEFGPTYSAIAAAGIANESTVRQTVVDAGVYAELGASGRTVNGFQRLDNLYVAAEYGALAAQGKPYLVATDDQVKSGEAQRRANELFPGVKAHIFNTGVFDGQAVYEAARRGDNQALYTGLFTAPQAVALHSSGLAVEGLRSRPALGRDAVMATLLRQPHAFDGQITRLESLATGPKVSRYHALADTLKDTRNAVLKYQRTHDPKYLTEAGLRYADFFSDMEKAGKTNGGAWRDNAWGAFIDSAANDPTATSGLLATMAGDPAMRDATIKGLPDALVEADGVRGTNRGKLGKGHQLPDNIRGDAVYKPRIISTSEGEFKEQVNTALLTQAAAGAASQPAAATPLLTAKGIEYFTALAAGNKSAEEKARLVDKALKANAGNVSTALSAAQIAELKALVTMGGTPAAAQAALLSFSAGTDTAGVAAAPEGLTSAARTAAGSLANAGVHAAGMPSTNTAAMLGVAPVVVLGAGGKNPTAALAAIIVNSGIPIPPSLAAELQAAQPAGAPAASPAEMLAAALIAGKMVTVTSAGELAASTNTASAAQDNTAATAGHMAAGAGVAKFWALFGLKLIGGEPPSLPIPPGTVPGCPTVPRGTPINTNCGI